MNAKLLFIRILITVSVFLSVVLFSCNRNDAPLCDLYTPETGSIFEEGDTITFKTDATDSDGTITEVRYYVNNEGHSLVNAFPYEFELFTSGMELGKYTIKAEAFDELGASTTDEVEIELIERMLVPIPDFEVDRYGGRAPLRVQFTDKSINNPTSWHWDFGDGETSREQNPVHVFRHTGYNYVTFTVENRKGSNTNEEPYIISITDSIGFYYPCLDQPTVTDVDGNEYNTVYMQGQCWLKENLKVTHYPDGTEIQKLSSDYDWAILADNNTDGAYCTLWFDEELNFGHLYTWAAAVNGDASGSQVQGICPDGWHIPTQADWELLYTNANELCPYHFAGLIMSHYDDHWYRRGNNTTQFSAVGTGFRNATLGSIEKVKKYANWWSSTNESDTTAFGFRLNQDEYEPIAEEFEKSSGFAVRCIKD